MKAKDIRKGKVLMYNGAPHSVMEFQHRTPGNLRAFVQVKLRNLISKSQTETRFSSTEDITEADVYNFSATYLYRDGQGFHFMNSETYEEAVLSDELVGDSSFFLSDGMSVGISTFNDEPISVAIPASVVMEIVDTQPELKGATASNSPKPATTSTGLKLNVPAFVKIGDKVLVDTQESKYLSRVD